MDIEELYRCVFNNVSKNQYDKAFEIALSAYQSYTLNELDEFFRKSPPVYQGVISKVLMYSLSEIVDIS